jgi:hypothetical protein
MLKLHEDLFSFPVDKIFQLEDWSHASLLIFDVSVFLFSIVLCSV